MKDQFSLLRRLLGKFLLLSLGFICILFQGTPLFANTVKQSAQYRADRIILKPKPGQDSLQSINLHSSLGNKVHRQFRQLNDIQVIQLKPGVSVEAAIAAYESTGLFEYVEPDYLVHANASPNDPSYANGTLWGLHNTGQSGGTSDADIDAPEGWDSTTDASSVVVAVIDTGVRFTHQDLSANMWTNLGEIAGNGIDDDSNGYVDDVYGINAITGSGNPSDDHGHGTHVAGTIGAVGNNGIGITGVAWRVKLMALKFLSSGGSGSTSDAIECINYARLKGARIMNNSWGGGGFSQALKDAIDAAKAADIVFVAAAGNDTSNNDSFPQYPASYTSANIVAVASTTRNDGLSSFSNYGATSVDLGAPGDVIYSTSSASDSSYVFLSGTSMATPQVSGVLALLKAKKPAATYAQLIEFLLRSTDPISALTGKCVTQGRLNLAKTLAVDPPTVSITSPANNAILPRQVSIAINATADDGDADGSVAKVDFYAGNTLIGADTSSPYSVSWQTPNGGSFSLKARAFDNLGDSADSALVNVQVNRQPFVGIISPAQGTIFSPPSSITITASATDDGSISTVEFFSGAQSLVTLTSSPYTFLWTNVGKGSYALTATATDNHGDTFTCSALSFTVNQLPGISITNPLSGTIFQNLDDVTVNATPTDTDGTISKVQFYLDESLISEDSNGLDGYSCQIPDITPGNYELRAVAVDDLGGTASATVGFFVKVANPQVVEVSVHKQGASESGIKGWFKLTRTGGAAGSVNSMLQVHYETGGTASNGGDYKTLSGTITFLPGRSEVFLPIVPIKDVVSEDDETINLSILNDPYYDCDSPGGLLVLIKDAQPRVSVRTLLSTASENGSSARFEILRRRCSIDKKLVIFYSVSGSATSGADFVSLSGSVTIPAGAASAKVNLTALDDLLSEGTEAVTITLSTNSAYWIVPESASANINITDNDVF